MYQCSPVSRGTANQTRKTHGKRKLEQTCFFNGLRSNAYTVLLSGLYKTSMERQDMKRDFLAILNQKLIPHIFKEQAEIDILKAWGQESYIQNTEVRVHYILDRYAQYLVEIQSYPLAWKLTPGYPLEMAVVWHLFASTLKNVHKIVWVYLL